MRSSCETVRVNSTGSCSTGVRTRKRLRRLQRIANALNQFRQKPPPTVHLENDRTMIANKNSATPSPPTPVSLAIHKIVSSSSGRSGYACLAHRTMTTGRRMASAATPISDAAKTTSVRCLKRPPQSLTSRRAQMKHQPGGISVTSPGALRMGDLAKSSLFRRKEDLAYKLSGLGVTVVFDLPIIRPHRQNTRQRPVFLAGLTHESWLL
jgi:hypothetical protein